MSVIKSPLRYPGGKSRAVRFLTNLIPNYDEFREPFLGGGSVYINLKQIFPDKIYWVNDLYYDLYNFWIQAQSNIELVVNEVKTLKQNFENGKQLYAFLNENYKNFNNLQKAAGFFVYNRITFSGTSESGGYSEGSFKGRFTDTSIERLANLRYVLNETEITNLDYAPLLTEPGKNVVIFLDPPYYSAKKSALYGKNGNMHKYFNYELFAERVRECAHRWLITLDDSEYVRDLFSFANIHNWNLIYGMRNQTDESDQIGKELIISNYVTDENIKASLKLLSKTAKNASSEIALFSHHI